MLRGTFKFITERVATLSYLEYFLGIWQKTPFFVVGEKKQVFLGGGMEQCWDFLWAKSQGLAIKWNEHQ